MPTPNPETGEIVRFSDVLRKHAGGQVDDEATDHLTEAIAAAVALDKTSTVAIAVKIEPQRGGGYVLSLGSSNKLPSLPLTGKHYYMDPATGMPTTRDPAQPSIPGIGDDLVISSDRDPATDPGI